MLYWILSVVFTWMIISVVMYVFTAGKMSPVSPDGNEYWKWSAFLAVCLNIPLIGWIIAGVVSYKNWPKFPY